MSIGWSPEQYLKFQPERFAPFRDLMELIKPRAGLRAIDLGCGSGELTASLTDRFERCEVLGIDSSPQMLGKAKLLERPGVRFQQMAIEEAQGRYDLILSNAALHWVSDHPRLFGRLAGMLNDGGQIVVQMPSAVRNPAQSAVAALAAEEPFAQSLRGWRWIFPVMQAEAYAELLFSLGLSSVVVFEKVYSHLLPDADAVYEWLRGTTMLPYCERLPGELQTDFESRLRMRLHSLYPDRPTLFPFRRLFISACSASQR